MHHMQDEKVAKFIKRIATISNHSDIALEVGQPVCPKYVCRQFPDHFRKCIWILTKKFHYQCKELKTSCVDTMQSCLSTLTDFGPPIIAILKGTKMSRDHVVGIWQNQIVDFESPFTYLLTENNLNYACGEGCNFLGLVKPTALFPPHDVIRNYQPSKETKYVWTPIGHESVTMLQR